MASNLRGVSTTSDVLASALDPCKCTQVDAVGPPDPYCIYSRQSASQTERGNMKMHNAIAGISIALISGIAASQTTDLLLFGGRNHKTFLGCLNCGQYDSNSVCNNYGTYGSRYQSDSIWNAYGTYGSKYSSESPWNKYGSDAPVIVDRKGGFYGYFSSNRYLSKRTTIKDLVALADAADDVDDLEKLADAFCKR